MLLDYGFSWQVVREFPPSCTGATDARTEGSLVRCTHHVALNRQKQVTLRRQKQQAIGKVITRQKTNNWQCEYFWQLLAKNIET